MDLEECEDYLEAIINNSIEDLTTENITVLASTFTKNNDEVLLDLKHLEEMGYLSLVKADDGKSPVKLALSPYGYKKGKCTIKKHHILESFFSEILGMDTDAASKEACTLEHDASINAIKRLDAYINSNPAPISMAQSSQTSQPQQSQRSPYENTDPEGFTPGFGHRRHREMRRLRMRARSVPSGEVLTFFPEGAIVKILYTAGCRGRTDRLHDLGIIPGEIVTIKQKLSNGSMVLMIKSMELGISPEIAGSVFACKAT